MELGITYDQLNCSELGIFELMARRFQLLEERYARQLLESEMGKAAEDLGFEQALFMGADRSRGRALIAPALEEWVASKLKDEAAILKERRKGREERQLARSGGSSSTAPGPAAEGGKPKAGGGKRS